MKRFMAIFCSVLMLSSVSAYAGQKNYNRFYRPSSIKYFWCKPSTNKNTCTTTQTTVAETTTQAVSKPVETTTQAVVQKPVETTTTVTEATTEETTAQTTTNMVTDSDSASMAKQVLDLVNKERAKNNLSPLMLNNSLSNVAQLKSEDMKNKNYFDHTSPTYGSPFDMMKKFNISYKYAGENIAKGQKTAEAVVNAWMNSEGHRKNILNSKFTDMGIGYVKANGTTYWTQMFIQK